MNRNLTLTNSSANDNTGGKVRVGKLYEKDKWKIEIGSETMG